MKLVVFNGPPGSGKDTCCEILSNGTKVRHHSMASILKKATHALFGVNYLPEKYFEGGLKEQPTELFAGMTPREAYIKVSENMVKPCLGDDFFAETSVRILKDDPLATDAVCFSDCGFQNELNVFAKEFGEENVMVVHLERDGCDFSKDSRDYVMPMGGMKHRLINNNGSLLELAKEIEKCYRWILGE